MTDTFIEAPWLAVLIFFSLTMPVLIWYEARALSDNDDDEERG